MVVSEYNSRIAQHLPGKTIKVDFELCFEYCETCKALGITKDNQYCVTCKENYRFDYFNYFGIYPSNCVPENKFNDLEKGTLEECTTENSKFYYNTTDGKRYCFKYDYECPPPYPYLNITTHECLNITLPTTIITTIPKIIPTTIITTIPKIITTVPKIITTVPKIITTLPKIVVTTILKIPEPVPTIPRVKCTYQLLIEDKCDFTNDTNTEIYGQLKNDVIETYPDGGHSAGVKIKNDLYFEMTTVSNEKSIIKGSESNDKNVSIIDLGDCEKKLIAVNHLPENTDLIILKLETLTTDKNG